MVHLLDDFLFLATSRAKCPTDIGPSLGFVGSWESHGSREDSGVGRFG